MMNQRRQCISVAKWPAFSVLLLLVLLSNVVCETQSFQIEFLQMIDGSPSVDRTALPVSVFRTPLKGAAGEVRRPLGNSTSAQTKVAALSKAFKKSVNKIKHKNKRMDIVFLIDSSSSVGKNNFHSELKFVKKFLSDFNVSFNHTRIAIVTFSSKGKIVSIGWHSGCGFSNSDITVLIVGMVMNLYQSPGAPCGSYNKS